VMQSTRFSVEKRYVKYMFQCWKTLCKVHVSVLKNVM